MGSCITKGEGSTGADPQITVAISASNDEHKIQYRSYLWWEGKKNAFQGL